MESGELIITEKEIETLIKIVRVNSRPEKRTSRGVIMTYGLCANEIVKLVAKNEGISLTQTKPKNGKNEIQDKEFDTLIYEIDNVYFSKGTDKYGKDLFYSLKKLKNYGSHIFDIEKIEDYDGDAEKEYKRLEKWLLNDYLGNHYDSVVKNIDGEIQATIKRMEDEEKAKEEKATSERIEKEKVEEKEKKKAYSWNSWGNFIFGAVVGFLITSIWIGNTDDSEDESLQDTRSIAYFDQQIDSSKVYDIMDSYYKSINSPNYNAFNYFDGRVGQFITKMNITPDSINRIHNLNNEFIQNTSAIQKETIKLDSVSGGISYWHFLTDFMCYRNSRNQYESCQLPMFIGLNSYGKITMFKEGKPINLKWFDKKPVN